MYTNTCRRYGYIVLYKSGCGSVWLERHLREVEAASSNLVTPTNRIVKNTAEPKGFAVFLRLGVSPKQ